MAADDILLGDGIFSIAGVDIALTRGGGKFTVEREFREIEADGDYGVVKGRVRLIKSRAKLEINLLEILDTKLASIHPGLVLTTSDAAKNVLTGVLSVSDSDYQSTVKWTGYTKAGKAVVIILQNAINMENIEWETKDKEEIINKATYTAAFLSNARTTEPWSVEFAKTASGDATAPVMSVIAPSAGAKTVLMLQFNEYLHATTLAITDRFNLLSGITNDGVAVAITTLASSVAWYNSTTSAPYCLVTIASTTFVATKTVRVNAKTSAIKDLSSNEVLAATNFEAVVSA
jgi:hypothetical protein